MPQVQVVDTTERPPEPTGIQELFSKLGKSFKDQNDRVEIGKIIDEYKNNRKDANAWENLQLDLEKSNISPTKRLETQASLNAMKKNIIEQDKALNGKTSAKIDEYDKKLKQKGGEEAIKLQGKIPEYDDILTNLQEVRSFMKKELKGPKGYIKSFVGSESASKVRNLSASALSGIIKTFNPAGTLPTAKLNWIRDTFAVNPTDNESAAEGKISALETLIRQQKARDTEKLALLNEYKGIIPSEAMKSFEAQTAAENDSISDELAFKLKIKGLSADEPVNDMYDQNGEKLGPIPKKEAEKLFEQGLITNVPK